MRKLLKTKLTYLFGFSLVALLATPCMSAVGMKTTSNEVRPMVVWDFLKRAKKNSFWKVAFITGESEQIVFMNVSPNTTPSNEIGMEMHPFDQVILIVEGKGEAVFNGKIQEVKKHDLIFIPKGTEHNVINREHKKPLRLVSFYSAQDIPNGAVYKTKADEQKPH
jgi:mannose-6-phosphate isomerase-like protein (cupin superfamily)